MSVGDRAWPVAHFGQAEGGLVSRPASGPGSVSGRSQRDGAAELIEQRNPRRVSATWPGVMSAARNRPRRKATAAAAHSSLLKSPSLRPAATGVIQDLCADPRDRTRTWPPTPWAQPGTAADPATSAVGPATSRGISRRAAAHAISQPKDRLPDGRSLIGPAERSAAEPTAHTVGPAEGPAAEPTAHTFGPADGPAAEPTAHTIGPAQGTDRGARPSMPSVQPGG
jgi:hypothetical protein